MKTQDRTVEEELADLEDQKANIERRIEELKARKARAEDFMTPALRHPGFRAWRERRMREERGRS